MVDETRAKYHVLQDNTGKRIAAGLQAIADALTGETVMYLDGATVYRANFTENSPALERGTLNAAERRIYPEQ
ncbi:MAG: hypothetical protein IJV64_05870 [Oscillospiraceae bacterium]|nr:hypothetical protein [Oscillospiraceae bacterium]